MLLVFAGQWLEKGCALIMFNVVSFTLKGDVELKISEPHPHLVILVNMNIWCFPNLGIITLETQMLCKHHYAWMDVSDALL